MTVPNKLNPLNLSHSVQFAQPDGLSDVLKIAESIKFGEVAWVQKRVGSYVPNDDIFALLTEDLAADQTANLVLLQVEGHANFIEFNRNDDWGGYHTVHEVFLKVSPDSSGYDRPKQFFLDGRLAAPKPMAQGEPVRYCLLIAQVAFA